MPNNNKTEVKKPNPMSLSVKLKCKQMEFAQEQRQQGARAVTTEVVKQINGWSEGQSSFNNKLALITGIPALATIAVFVYELYQWDVTGSISMAKLIMPFIAFIVCVGIFVFFQQKEGPKNAFTELKEVEEIWLKGDEK